MIDNPDFLPMPISKTDTCCCRNCNSIPGKDQYYLTEWDLITGASCTFSYCEKCILKHSKNLVLRGGEISMDAQTTRSDDIMSRIEKMAKAEKAEQHVKSPRTKKDKHGIINGVAYKDTTHPYLQKSKSSPNPFFTAKDVMGNYVVRRSKRSIGELITNQVYIRFWSSDIDQANKDVELLVNHIECPVGTKKTINEALNIPETEEPLVTATTMKDVKSITEKQEPQDITATDLVNGLNKIVQNYEEEMETIARNFQRKTGLRIEDIYTTIVPTENGMPNIKIKFLVGLA